MPGQQPNVKLSADLSKESANPRKLKRLQPDESSTPIVAQHQRLDWSKFWGSAMHCTSVGSGTNAGDSLSWRKSNPVAYGRLRADHKSPCQTGNHHHKTEHSPQRKIVSLVDGLPFHNIAFSRVLLNVHCETNFSCKGLYRATFTSTDTALCA
jgi:hypothetical protein